MRPGIEDRITQTLARGRAMAEARMRATCTIERPIPGEEIDDPFGPPGSVLPRYEAEPVYVGKCRLRYPGLAFEQTPMSAGATLTLSRNVLHIPFGAIIRPGDVVTIDSDRDNPQLVGTTLRVASIDDQSQATAQRILCEDYQAGVAP